MNSKTKVHKKWDVELTRYLKNITWCERCGSSNYLSKAHRLKRRFIGYESEFDKQEYFMAAKLCQTCHVDLDEGKREDPHRVMFEIITSIVLKRDQSLITGFIIQNPVIEYDTLSYEKAKQDAEYAEILRFRHEA